MGGNGSVAKAQLWGLLVVASDDPDLGSEKRADEGKLVDVEARQLGGCDGQDAVASGEWVRVGVSVERGAGVCRPVAGLGTVWPEGLLRAWVECCDEDTVSGCDGRAVRRTGGVVRGEARAAG